MGPSLMEKYEYEMSELWTIEVMGFGFFFFISNFYQELFLWNYKLKKKIMKYKQTGIGIYKIDITVTWIRSFVESKEKGVWLFIFYFFDWWIGSSASQSIKKTSTS